MTAPQPGATDNLASLENLNEGSLMRELQTRFDQDVIYTYVGEILVSVNPFKPIDGLYSEAQAHRYTVVGDKGQVPPHLFTIADLAFQNMVQGGKDQACVISGESGAGKTEAAKLFVKHLIHVSNGSEMQGLHTKLVQLNPLLEAFGNAQTLMNDNSSRFGKFTEIVFNKEGGIRGAIMSQYLLEKSRVVHQNPGEQSFHVFYLLHAGASDDDRTTFALREPHEYEYLAGNPAALEAIATPEMAAASKELRECISTIGFTSEEAANLWALLSGVLMLGNLTFVNDDTAEVAAEPDLLQDCCAQLGLDEHTLKLALTRSVNVIRGEETERAYKLHEAVDCRNATSKALYNRAFGWVFQRCNQLLGPQKRNATDRSIGILDIFGFECFDTNSFEQLCINLANEQLQYFFNEHIFRMELQEYEREGIDGATITYTDNKPLLDLFLKPKTGFIALLDEESNFPRATDDTLVRKLHTAFSAHQDYTRPRGDVGQFTLRHYAGAVQYDADGFLYKNRDRLAVDVIGALRVSENNLVRTLFGAESPAAGGGKGHRKHGAKAKRGLKESKDLMRASTRQARAELARKQRASVATTFKKSLSELMGRLNVASPHFVRCVKPNMHKLADDFDEEMVAKQLRYTGMLETTRIRREGYSYRPLFADFVNRYKVLAWNVENPAGSQATCRRILDNARAEGYLVGKTKVFLRYWHVDTLNAAVRPVQLGAMRLQSVVRGFLGRRRVAGVLEQARQQRAQVENFLVGANRMCLGCWDVLQYMCEQDEKRHQALLQRQATAAAAAAAAASSSGGSTGEEEDVYPPCDPNPPLPARPAPGNSPSMQPRRRRTDQREKSVKWFRDVEKQKGAGMADDSTTDFAQWFHGVISRKEAEKLLKDQKSGTFLVRVAESRFGYSLSLIHGGRVKHFMINVNDDNEYQLVGNDRRFQSLNAIVHYHETHSVTSAHDRLNHPCPRQDSANLTELA